MEERKRPRDLPIHEPLLDENGSASDEKMRLTVTRRSQPARSLRHTWGVAGFYAPDNDTPASQTHPCAGYLGYPCQNKQGKSGVENLARDVDKYEKIGVVVIISAFFWNGYPM